MTRGAQVQLQRRAAALPAHCLMRPPAFLADLPRPRAFSGADATAAARALLLP